ncbi:cytoplasmic protein [Kwoniella mangroviensis CBS 10435]|uniref:Cytoplasmic protein n=1 Tax=Kwoniella mangroviensis CBS 10435 TaxID=1331196 RepID=A0A1B9IEU8_9TREE|nr:cytoplasmic protein [Kwoniella mangroviensis CBS 10435]
MTIVQEKKIPVTCFTGFLGAGKTSTILSLIQQLPKDYKVVLLKNEYGDVEVDSLLASQSNISGVSEILNGCLCCTMVGLVENAIKEIRDTMQPDRIIIESSGSAFPATLALQIRQLEPEGFKLDGVVTVVDSLNFKGYEDSSPSAKLQAKYTDLLLLSKHHLATERQMDDLIDSLNELNDETPKIKIGPAPDNPPKPELIFGLDTKLFGLVEGEKESWDKIGGRAGWHGDEVETKQIYIGKKGKAKSKHNHEEGEHCEGCEEEEEDEEEIHEIQPVDRELLDKELSKLSFEIYRVKGLIRLLSAEPSGYTTNILNYAFGRYELTPIPSLDEDDSLKGVSLRLTVMGERGEVARRARKLAEWLGAQVE